MFSELSPLKYQTKVIWSFDDTIPLHALEALATEPAIDALRVVYRGQALSALEALRMGHKDGAYNPIMLDLGGQAQGTLYHPESICPKELTVGQIVHLRAWEATLAAATPPATQVLWVQAMQPWEELFINHATVFLGNGPVVLKIEVLPSRDVTAVVIQGGTVTHGMDLHVKETKVTSTFEDLKKISLTPLKGQVVDFIVLPGFAQSKDIIQAKAWIAAELPGTDPWVLVRVDHQAVISHLNEVLREADGVLILRKDLGMFIEPALVPMLTKEIIQTCNNHACVAVVASDMLASMHKNPTPTRAEVSDIANAVIDGTDAIVISEEASSGHYPERSLQLCGAIIEDVEAHGGVEVNWKRSSVGIVNELDAVAYHAFRTAERVGAKALVCITKAGNTALRLASFRVPMPILAFTFSAQVARKLSLVRGVKPLLLESKPELDRILPHILETLKRHSWLKVGDKIIFVTVSLSPISTEASNLFTIHTLE